LNTNKHLLFSFSFFSRFVDFPSDHYFAVHLLDASKDWRPESRVLLEPHAAFMLFGKSWRSTLTKLCEYTEELCANWNEQFQNKVSIIFKTKTDTERVLPSLSVAHP